MLKILQILMCKIKIYLNTKLLSYRNIQYSFSYKNVKSFIISSSYKYSL